MIQPSDTTIILLNGDKKPLFIDRFLLVTAYAFPPAALRKVSSYLSDILFLEYSMSSAWERVTLRFFSAFGYHCFITQTERSFREQPLTISSLTLSVKEFVTLTSQTPLSSAGISMDATDHCV